MNVRVPTELREAIDHRRSTVGDDGISRDEWVTRALTWALRQPRHKAAVHGIAPTVKGRRSTRVRRLP